MDIHSVKKVFETDFESIANQKLQKGWILLKVDTIDVRDSQQLVYVLGWTHNESEEEYNKNKNDLPF